MTDAKIDQVVLEKCIKRPYINNKAFTMEHSQSTAITTNYDVLLKGSNVVESTFIDNKIAEEHLNFDSLEFSKDIREIDF